jgi:hypothetical protein
MSYDLMVFDQSVAPRGRKEFLAWYRKQCEWGEGHSYDNPEVSSPELRAWFLDMIRSFPPMNGPLASDDVDNPKVTDYSVGKSVIYAAFAWSQAQFAYQTMISLASEHRVGFYDVSSGEGKVWLPGPDGRLVCVHQEP